MMRKDVRIGFAVGGVLLAVLIVYGLVTSGPTKNTEVTLAPESEQPPAAATDAPAPANTGSSPSQPRNGDRPSNGQSSPPQNGSATDPFAPTPTGGSGTSNSGNGSGTNGAKPNVEDKWAHALNTGQLMMLSETPTPSNGGAPNPSDNTTSPQAQSANGSGAAGAGAAQTPSGGTSTDAGAGAGAGTNTGAPDPANPQNSSSGTGGPTGAAFDAGELARLANPGPSTQPAGSTPSTGGSAQAPPPGARTHVVQRGETFSSIAEAAYGSESYYPHILRANPGIDPKRLKAGMSIVLPERDQVVATKESAAATPPAGAGAGAQTAAATLPPIDERTEYRVQPAESLYKISQKLYGRADKVDAIYQLNKDAIGPNPSRLKAGLVLRLPEPPTSSSAAR